MPINLKTMFGDRWKVKFDQDTATLDRQALGICPKTADEWYYYIECPKGDIRAYGHDQISLYHCKAVVLKNLVKIFSGEGATSYISSVDGFLYFSPIIAEKIFEYVKARKKRILTEEQKNAIRERTKSFRFQKSTEKTGFNLPVEGLLGDRE